MGLLNKKLSLIVSTALVSCFYVGVAQAQNAANAGDDPSQLQEIIVTAQKRSENLQRVPVSVSAFDSVKLQAANIRDAADLGKITPGLVITRGDRNLTPYLRGVGSDVNPVGFESSVAVYVDGVYFPRLSPGFLNLADVERVEVLKGPQGTLFGRNASGGLVNIISADPDLEQMKGKAQFGYSNYETVTASGYASVPLGSKVAVSLTGSYGHQNNGYGINTVTGNRTSYMDNATIRGKLLFAPSDDTKILLSGYYLKSQSSAQGNTYPGTTQGYTTQPYAALAPAGFYDQRGNLDTVAKSKGYGGFLRLTHEFDFATFTSTTSYQHIREFGISDNDYLDRDEFNGNTNSFVKTITQELQLASPSTGVFKWTAGLYYFRSKASYEPFAFRGELFTPAFNSAPLDIYGEQTSKSYAAYAQGTYSITDQLGLTLGGRYSHDEIAANGRIDANFGTGAIFPAVPQSSASTKDDRFSFRAALDYKFNDNAMVYASFNRGYKAGTYSILPFTPSAARPEVLDAYEAGFKTEFFDRRVRLNGAAFYYDIKNPQIQIIQSGSAQVSNARSARIKGAEIQLEAAPARGLSLNLAATYLDPKYKSFTNAAAFFPNPNTDPTLGPVGGTAAGSQVDASGTQMIHAPKFQFSASANYTVDTPAGKLDLSADYSHTASFYWHPDHYLKQPAYGLLGARARLGLTDNVGVSIWGKNLTNEKYVAFALEQAGPAGYAYIAGVPRTYGVDVDFKF